MSTHFKYYSKEEIQTHNVEKDCWIVFNGGVYDVTKYLQKHPGGKEILMKFAGKDGTEAFNLKGNGRGHIALAHNLRESFKIGILKFEEPKPKL